MTILSHHAKGWVQSTTLKFPRPLRVNKDNRPLNEGLPASTFSIHSSQGASSLFYLLPFCSEPIHRAEGATNHQLILMALPGRYIQQITTAYHLPWHCPDQCPLSILDPQQTQQPEGSFQECKPQPITPVLFSSPTFCKAPQDLAPAHTRRSPDTSRSIMVTLLLWWVPRQLISSLYVVRHALWSLSHFLSTLAYHAEVCVFSSPLLVSYVSQKTSCMKSNKPINCILN